VQRHAEVARVAEVVHFKVATLLLHQQRYGEALQQWRDHAATYGPLPGGWRGGGLAGWGRLPPPAPCA
jgi:hypothetical protein